MLKPNAELAYRVLDTAQKHDQHFDMISWGDGPDGPVSIADLTESDPDCGTTACLAGWTVALAGYRIDSGANVYDAAGNRLDVKTDELAAELLGIDMERADQLFYVTNDRIASRVEEIFGPRPGGASC